MEGKVVYSSLVLLGKESQSVFSEGKTKGLGIKADLMSDVTCRSEE